MKSNTEKNLFDVIVIGVGSMGSSACYYLAKQGINVLGLEQFDIPNELSSHAGQSRLIRKAYYEHSGYVPLLQRAYKNWKHLEDITGEQVYYDTGLLYFGKPAHPVLKGIHQSASQYNIPLIELDEHQMSGNYSSFDIPAGFEKLLEPQAGFITPGKAIRLYTEKAVECGAVIHANITVTGWLKTKDGITVQTAIGEFHSHKLIITAGPWAGKMLPQLSSSLTVTRQMLAWVEVNNTAMFALGKLPCWVIAEEDSPGIYYGFPILPAGQFEGPIGFKLAHHYPGLITDPNSIDRTPSTTDETGLIRVLSQYFPGAYKSTVAIKACMYTNTPDEHFIIDFLPGYEQEVVVATGFSGHGFKFASAVGEILTELILNGNSSLPIEFLHAKRLEKME